MGKKLHMAVVCGGKSGEHEVSLRSARSVIESADSKKYDLKVIGIDKKGRLGLYEWDFRNPIQAIVGGALRTYDHDSIKFRTVLVGLGVVPARGWNWSLQLTGAGGYQRFDGATDAGFENDLFENGGIFEILAELVYSPRL